MVAIRNDAFSSYPQDGGGYGASDRERFRLNGVEDERSLRWRSQLQAQSGVVSRQQARDAGWPEATIDERLRSGTWRRVHRGAYATFTGDISREARLWAAVLSVGPGATLSHQTAAEIHGLIDKPIRQIHISVPEERRPGQHKKLPGVTIHRSRCLVPEWQPPWHLPRTTVEDTVLDLIAAARTFDDAYGWISRAVGRQLTSPQSLSKALAAPDEDALARLDHRRDQGRRRRRRTPRWNATTSTAWNAPTACLQRGARPSEGTAAGPGTWTTCTRSTASASSSTELAAHPAEGRWRDTHRDNANLVQGTETLRYGWPDATEHRCQPLSRSPPSCAGMAGRARYVGAALTVPLRAASGHGRQ